MTNNASYLASDTTYRTLSNALCSKETPEEDKSSIVKRMLSLSSDGNELYTSFCDARFAGANLNVILPLLNKASDLKYAPAEATLGSYYFDGVPDYEKAADLLESAIVDHNSFDTPAKRRLGQCYLEGLGREKNVEKAQEYIVNAASEGDADAKAFLKNNNFP
ncbi:MAG: hypothetical protein Q4E13_12500, partial [Clostridia bacterium]|nr:hypothetical protein [Clostridia bacterium]